MTELNFSTGQLCATRRGETVLIVSLDPEGIIKTESPLSEGEAPEDWPVVYQVMTGRWKGLTGRVRTDGHAQIVRGETVDHENDIIA